MDTKFQKISPHSLLLWRIRLVMMSFVPAFFTFFFYYPDQWLWKGLVGFWILGFLLLYFLYYPIKYRKLSYSLNRRAFILHCGVIYTRIKSIYLENIQYVSVAASPAQHCLGIATVYIIVAGGSLHVPCLERRQAETLRDTLCPRLKEGDA